MDNTYYFDENTGKLYQWDGQQFVEVEFEGGNSNGPENPGDPRIILDTNKDNENKDDDKDSQGEGNGKENDKDEEDKNSKGVGKEGSEDNESEENNKSHGKGKGEEDQENKEAAEGTDSQKEDGGEEATNDQQGGNSQNSKKHHGYYENPKDGQRGTFTGWGNIDPEELAKEDADREAQIQREIDSLENELETSEAKLQRIDRIKDLLNNTDVSDVVEREARSAIQKEKALKAQRRRNVVSRSPINRFKLSLERFIKDEVSRKRTPTWKRENPRYEGTGIIRRGSMVSRNKNIPSINVYFDQSGSWDSNDIKIGMDALAVLDSYVKRKEIKINVFYFSNNLFDNAAQARAQGGTQAGPEVLDHISKTRPNNVIIMTDHDFDIVGNIRGHAKVEVPGAVWFLFRNSESIDLQNALSGRSQTEKFMLE